MSYSFIDLAEEVLCKSPQPLTFQEIWQQADARGLSKKLRTRGKTPWNTLGARLYVDVRDNPNSRFRSVGKRPSRFILKEREADVTEAVLTDLEADEPEKHFQSTKFHERDLHPLLTYFVYANPTFSRGRRIYTKTIRHEQSKRGGYNEWLHPDIVGVYLPLDDWKHEVIAFNQLLDKSAVRLFSFELKKTVDKGNYRESFFQAVSNSSWAHEGYLVSPAITKNDDLLTELGRLSSAFGIGIIELDLSDFDSSTVMFPARVRPMLDWETVNKLCEQNTDFEKFVQAVRIDFDSKKFHPSEYDTIEQDPESYITRKFG
ncbi:MAG: hypothetical protein AMXMBFR84_17940 [Candidatus Hydrogenedentota bacterium]